MIVLERGQTSDCSDPKLLFVAQQDGWATDVASLEFQIFDTSTECKELNPVQVYPAIEGNKETIDVATDCPTGGKVGLGRFVAEWTVPADEAYGQHQIKWFWTWEVGGTEYSASVPFEVLSAAGAIQDSLYTSVGDMRAEGVTLSDASDARLLLTIKRASKYIERVTGRFFEPRYMTIKADGHGGKSLLLGHPIISVEQIEFTTASLTASTIILPDDASSYRIYNRHLSGLIVPDDRANPRIDLWLSDLDYFPGLRFSFLQGKQNVAVTGSFGYTDYDGSPSGCTPELIRRACQLIVMRDIAPIGDTDAREDATRRHRLLEEKTRDQSYKLAPLGGSSGGSGGGGRFGAGAFTGDPEIDRILGLYVRPPMLGAA